MRRLTAIVAVLLFASITLDAHLVLPADFRTVVNDASLIVRGRVTDVRSVRVQGHGIDTIATVAVEKVLKGSAGGFVYVRVPGGQIGRTRFVMVGAPTFRVGERDVFFLRPGATDTSFRPIGLTLGVYPVQPDASNRRLVVQPPLVAGRNTAATGATVRGDPRRQAMSLPEFESLIRLVVAAPAGQAVPRRGR